jgi:hypothetical protein
MIPERRHFAGPMLALLAILAGGPASGAPDDDVEVEDAVAAPVQQHMFVMNDAQFDQWAFGGVGNLATIQRRMDSLLTLKIEEVHRTCLLTDDQKQKLRLAGRGDVKRFFDRIEEKRRKYLNRQFAQNEIGPVFQELQPLQTAMNAGLFHESSFFAKAVPRTLDEGQAERLAEAARTKKADMYRSKVLLAVTTLGKTLGLNAEQRQKFTAVLVEETRPPKVFGQQDVYAVLYQASRLPEEKLRPIFDDAQWLVLSRHLTQAKSMEPFLKSNGYVPDDDGEPAGPKPGAAPAPNNL